MKNTVMATLAALMTIGAVAPASAWTYTHCKAAEGLSTSTVSNGTLAKNCHAWIVGQGRISRDHKSEETWSQAFPGVHFADITSSKVKGEIEDPYNKRTLILKVNGKQALRTKEMKKSDTQSFLDHTSVKMVAAGGTSKEYAGLVTVSKEAYTFVKR